MDYNKKYIKYKTKYIDLKLKQKINLKGGSGNGAIPDNWDATSNKKHYNFL